MKKFIIFYSKIFIILLLNIALFEQIYSATLSNISVSPSSLTAGGYVTLIFSINTNNATSYYVVSISPYANFNCAEFNATNPTQYNVFVVNADGVYDSSMSVPDYIGPSSANPGSAYGISINTGTSTQALTYVFKVPEDAPTGNLYAHVIAGDWSLDAYPTSCTAPNILNSPAIYVNGIDQCLRLDLQMFQSSSSPPTQNNLQMSVVIKNWGIWPVPINGLKYRWYFYDTYGSYCCSDSVPDNNNEIYNRDGRSYLGQVGHVVQSFNTMTTQNCSGGRSANQYVEVALSGSVGQVIPGGG